MKQDTALLVIDLQVGMFAYPEYPVYAEEKLLDNVRNLISKARSCNVPVIYVQHNEGAGEPLESLSEYWQIHSLLTPADGDAIVQKYTPDSFHETNLQELLSAKGIKKLVLAGMQTDMCIDATVRKAHNLGYEAVVASDAHSTYNQEGVTAAEIIDRHNEEFRQFAQVAPSSTIECMFR